MKVIKIICALNHFVTSGNVSCKYDIKKIKKVKTFERDNKSHKVIVL